MGIMGTQSSPGVRPNKNDGIKSQNLPMNPSSNICKFTDPEIQSLASYFPSGAIFRPFDPSTRSDVV
ncbi:hypothetical protein Hanom_Chr11g01007931 [Helianthus anomalus]